MFDQFDVCIGKYQRGNVDETIYQKKLYLVAKDNYSFNYTTRYRKGYSLYLEKR